MNRDEIIRMAREAGWPVYSLKHPLEVERLERFAALVAAAEREAAVKAEREECANVAESERMEGPAPVGQIHPEIILAVEMTCRETGKSIAEKIRARSQP